MVRFKILWFCNVPMLEGQLKGTGGWLYAMANALVRTGKVELYVITSYPIKKVERLDFKSIKQWLVPRQKLAGKGLPGISTIRAIQKIVKEVSPDLIHIWGTESYWGLLFARGYLRGRFLLEMQGVMASLVGVSYGGLSPGELVRCLWIKELIRPRSSLFFQKKKFIKKAVFEREIIKCAENISTQSEWVRAYVGSINPGCTIFKTGIILREAFYQAQPWDKISLQGNDHPTLFASSSASYAFKGLHVLIRALFLLKQDYPNIRLEIAGHHVSQRFTSIGYVRWLLMIIKKLDLESNVDWLGALDEDGIIDHLQKSSVFIVPSFVESYSLALAESLLLGVPTVVSYAGAMPELANNEDSALFFPVGDFVMCAHQVKRLLRNPSLSEKVSHNARLEALKRNNPKCLVDQQVKIYNDLISHH